MPPNSQSPSSERGGDPRANPKKSTSAADQEFVVTREFFDQFFEKPMPTSSFHDLVQKGRILPWNGMRGRYLLNGSLKRLGLPALTELPSELPKRSLEDITRFGFTLIDHNLFPPPPWVLTRDIMDIGEADLSRRLSDQYRDRVEAFDSNELKLAYFGGVLDAAFKDEEDGGALGWAARI